jgi:hypothetical protein
MSTKNSPIEKIVKEVIKKKPKINTFVDKLSKVTTPEVSINDSVTFTGSVETVTTIPVTNKNEISLKYLFSKLLNNKTIKWGIILTLLLIGVFFYLKTQKKQELNNSNDFKLEKDNIIDIQGQQLAQLMEQQEHYRKELFAMGLQNKANFQQFENMLNNMNSNIEGLKNIPPKKHRSNKTVTIKEPIQEEEIIISEEDNVAEHELTMDELDAINEQLNDINV